MLRRLSQTVVAGLLMLLMGSVNLSAAQSTTGGVTGSVADSTGAVIAGASVEILNVGTGEKRTTTTNDNGNYSIPNLDPGVYEVTISAINFSTSTIKEVKVSVSFTTSVNVELKPGQSTEVVEITGADAQVQINTTDQQLSTLIDNKKILELPLLSRNPNALILLSPGVVQTQSALGGFSVNGSRERNNNFTVDGVDNNETDVPGSPGGLTTPNIDATQEFRVITNNFNAEFGRNTGAIINVATKSGSNEYHGGIYYYNRSDTFSARDFFDTTGKSDPLHRNQFGGSIGGPILKDRFFFFANYEGDRFNIGGAQTRQVPSAAARQGIFPNTPFGPLDVRENGSNNDNGFPINPISTMILNSIYPLGNDPLNAILPGTFDSFRFIGTTRNPGEEINTRLDYQLTPANRLTGRYGFQRGDFDFTTETFPGFNDGITSLQRTSLFATTLTSIITPNLINEATFGFNRTNLPFNGQGSGSVPTTLDDAIRAAISAGGGNVNSLPVGTRNGQALNLSLNGAFDLLNFDTQTRFTGTTTVADKVTWVRGSHTFKTGFESRFVYANGDNNFGRSELVDFNVPSALGVPILLDNSGRPIPTTGLAGTVSDFASFLYGLVAFQTQTQYFDKSGARIDGDFRGYRTREIDFFFQDTWRILPNLTLNYGLRYDYKGVPFEVNGLLSTLVDQDPSGFTPAGGFRFQLVGANSGSDINLYNDDYNNFGPRFGFAWDPFKDGKTSIRGGYGVFYDRVFGNLVNNANGNLPFATAQFFLPLADDPSKLFIQNLPRPGTVPTKFNAFDGEELFPVYYPNKGAGGKANNPFGSEFRTPYSQNFNFGIQRELTRGMLLEADYIGTKGTKLFRVLDGQLDSVDRVNAITGSNNAISTSRRRNFLNGTLNTAFNGAALVGGFAFSSYNALTLRITKTLENARFGLGQIQAAYTLSHSIDNADDPLVVQPGGRAFPIDSSGFAGGFNGPERGESGFDTRSRFVLNFIYEFPFKAQSLALNKLVSGWSMSGIVTAQDGNPFTVFYLADTQGTNVSRSRARFANGVNPNQANNPNANPRLQTGPMASQFQRLDASIFNGPGDVPRSAFVGPGFTQVDFQVTKRISIAERHQFTIRADFFNLFNRVNLASPVNIVTDTRFGQSIATAGSPRIIQFVLRYNF